MLWRFKHCSIFIELTSFNICSYQLQSSAIILSFCSVTFKSYFYNCPLVKNIHNPTFAHVFIEVDTLCVCCLYLGMLGVVFVLLWVLLVHSSPTTSTNISIAELKLLSDNLKRSLKASSKVRVAFRSIYGLL